MGEPRQYLCRVSDDEAVRDVTDATDFVEDEDGFVTIDGVDYYVEWREPQSSSSSVAIS